MGTSGSEGGPGKPTSRKADRAPRSDPYTEHRTSWIPVVVGTPNGGWPARKQTYRGFSSG